jgi:hypothetical protein
MKWREIWTCLGLSCLIGTGAWAENHPEQPAGNPEPAGWYAGDAHVHLDCGVGSGHEPATPLEILAAMKTHNLAVVSLLADMGNGEVRLAERDLPQVNGTDHPASRPGRLLHWDAEWHFDPKGVTFEKKVLGGHLIILGLKQAETVFAESPYSIIEWAKKQNAFVGFAHMQYLNEGVPDELSCCLPLDYPVEVALKTVDFLMEDVWRNEAAIHAYYRLLNCGFRPGLAAGTDFPCNDRKPIGSLLTYASIPVRKLTYDDWIKAVAQGRTVISTNGHSEFLDLKVNGTAGPGGEILRDKPSRLPVKVRWTAIQPLNGRIELILNGKIIATQEGKADTGKPVMLSTSVEFKESSWLCARRMDEQGHQTHTAATFVTIHKDSIRVSAEDALYFVRFIDNLLVKTNPGGSWNQYFSKELATVQNRYRQAREIFQKIALEAQSRPGK